MAGGDGSEQQAAAGYIKEHRIDELTSNMLASLVFHQPDNPREHLLSMVEDLMKAREQKSDTCPVLYNAGNLDALYRRFDPAGSGTITMQQYREGMKYLGAKDFNPEPEGCGANAISPATFKTECQKGLQNAAATF